MVLMRLMHTCMRRTGVDDAAKWFTATTTTATTTNVKFIVTAKWFRNMVA